MDKDGSGNNTSGSVYDQLVKDIQRDFQANGVLVMVFGGIAGTGFAWGANNESYIMVRSNLPDLLRTLATAIEAQNKTKSEAASGGTN